MEAIAPSLPPAIWGALPAEAQTVILGLQAQVVALQARVRDLEARLGQDSSNSSRPPVF